jgi:hypothetical protein
MPKTETKTSRHLTVAPAAKAPRISAAIATDVVVPALVADAGVSAVRRFLEFFAATIRNKNTRMAYCRACRSRHAGEGRLPYIPRYRHHRLS